MTDETIISGGSDEEAAKAAEEKAAGEAKAAEDGKSPEEIKTAEEAKAAEEKAVEEKKAGETREGAPESYADFNMPEGVEADKGMLAVFSPLAKELNLSQENAQKLVDLQTKGLKDAMDAHVKEWAGAMGKWKDEVKADKEIGGEQFGQTQSNVTLALKTFGTEKLGEILEVTGVGNHVELVRFFNKVGTLVANDKIDLGNVVGDGPKSRAEIMYPNQGVSP